jgi:flagellar hook assembly protein FlgD
MRKNLCAFVFVISLAAAAHAGEEAVGTTSAAFLKLGSGARAAAMGEAYVGLANDASGINYNAAGIAQSLNGEIQATHTAWFQGLNYENLNGVFSVGDGGMLGLTLNFLSVPAITRTQQVGNDPNNPENNFIDDGSFSPFDLQAAVAYARPIAKGWLLGANFKLVSQSLDTKSTMGIALDLGTLWYTPIRNLTMGFAANNMGTPIKLQSEAFDLPLIFRLGGAYHAFDDQFIFTLEGDLPIDTAPVVAFGLEYNIANRFYPRLGYRLNSIFNPWSAGFGLQYDEWGLDMSVVPFGELGMTYRVSLNYRFGKPGVELTAPLAYANDTQAGKPAVLHLGMSAPDKVTSWAVYIYDSGRPAKIVRALSGSGPVGNDLLWDGHDKNDQPLPEGVYWSIVSARYTTGQVVNSQYVRLEISNRAPVVDLSLDPSSLNPRASGEAYIPTSFKPTLKSGRGIAAWRVELSDAGGKLFRTIQGDGALPDTVVWDGKGDNGDELISNSVYSARLWVKDALGGEGVSAVPVSFRAVFH